MNANLSKLVELIDAELSRLGLDHETYGSSNPVVQVDDDLPEGWVSIREEGYEYVAPAADMLAALAKGEPDGDEPIEALFAAMDNAGIRDVGPGLEPFDAAGYDGWKDNHEFAGLDLADGHGLVVFRTNGGLRYGFSPSSADYSAFNTTHDYSERYATAQEAIDAAETFAATEAAHEEG